MHQACRKLSHLLIFGIQVLDQAADLRIAYQRGHHGARAAVARSNSPPDEKLTPDASAQGRATVQLEW